MTAQAQLTRTWVSSLGIDTNPCSRNAPCRTFAAAQTATAEGGEINIVDPGSYGTITINKALTINGHNEFGAITAGSGISGVTVNVTTNPSTATVYLHDLSINGLHVGTDGIRYNAGANLVLDNVHIYGFTDDGIDVNGLGSLNFKAKDILVEDVAGDCLTMTTSGGQVVAMIDDATLRGCGFAGLSALNRVRASARNTVVTHTPIGVRTVGTDSILNVENIMVAFCGTGLRTTTATIPGRIRVSNSNISQNLAGADFATGGFIDSMGGNSFTGNAGSETFSSTTTKD
jgi:hypothetical protein